MFELDGDFDIDDAFLQDAFQQDSGSLNHLAVENDAGKRTFSEDEQSVCSKRNRVDDVHVLANSSNSDKCYESCESAHFTNRFNAKSCHMGGQVSSSPEERSSEIAAIQSTPDIFGAELPLPETSNDLYCDSNTHSERYAALRHTPNKDIAAADLSHSKRQRKFPGPAGLLPEKLTPVLPSKLIGQLHSSMSEQPQQEPLCSQRSVAVFEGAPWQKMLQDFTLNKKDGSPLEKFTVSWIRRRAAARQLIGQKVPFLAVVLQSIDCSSPDPCLVLRDKTGEIFGTLHREVWEKHGGQLVVGSVLALRQMGVLSTGPAARRHYLNITSNNLLTIYTPTENESVSETHLHKVSQKELIDAVTEWESSNFKAAKNHVATGSPTSANMSQPASVALWNTPGTKVHNISSDRNNSVWLNRHNQESLVSATSRSHNVGAEVYSTRTRTNSSSEKYIKDAVFQSKSDAKSQLYIDKSPACSNSSSRLIFGPGRTSDEIQSKCKAKESLAGIHNSFSPRICQSASSKISAFNHKLPVSRDITLTPGQSSEIRLAGKFTPKVPNNISLTPARQSQEFIPNGQSSSSSNAAEHSLAVLKCGKFTPKVPKSLSLMQAAESSCTPKSSKFIPKLSSSTPHMAPLGSMRVLNSASEIDSNIKLASKSSFSNNVSLKEDDLDSILGGLDTSSLFDDDF